MYLVLLSVGLLITAAGFLTIGFGIPINAFSLGNTLIIAGTVAVVGGLILVGIAAAVRQLNRIAEGLNGRAMARPAKAAEAADSLVPPTARIPPTLARTSSPLKSPEPAMPRPPEQRPAAEPHFPAAASEAPGPLDWMRPKRRTSTAQSSDSKPSAIVPPPGNVEPPVMEVPDEAPLSPRAPQRPLFSPPQFSSPGRESPQEPHAEPKSWSPSRSDAPEPRSQETPQPPVPRSEQVARASPWSERSKDAGRDYATDLAKDLNKDFGKSAGKDAGLFDVVWPDARSTPMSSEPVRREAKPEPGSPPPRSREESYPENRAENDGAAPAERPASILKSGVIDGMAYTLYVDGSIEAELAQGTVKFASVDALRAHLEKST